MAKHKIPRQSDRDIAEKLSSIQREIAPGQLAPVQFYALGHSINPVTFPQQDNAAWKQLLASNSTAIDQFNASAGVVDFQFYRGGHGEPKSPYFDEINIDIKNTEPGSFQMGASILSIFRPVAFAAAGGIDDGGVLAVRALQESMLDRLRAMHEDGVQKAAEHNEEIERRYLQRAAELDAAVAKRQGDLEAAATARLGELEAKEIALQERAKALDDRDNTHARRDIRDRMLLDVKSRIEQFGVSEATAEKRIPVLAGMALLTALLGLGDFLALTDLWSVIRQSSSVAQAAAPASGSAAIAAGVATATSGPLMWLLWARITLCSLGVAAMLLYYVRWQNKWAEQHSQSEFALQQFYIDVNRANWVIESCLEWRKETSSAIPGELLSSITRGLFTPTEPPPDTALHPADELAKALLGSSSKVKLKAGENEMEFNKPGKIPN